MEMAFQARALSSILGFCGIATEMRKLVVLLPHTISRRLSCHAPAGFGPVGRAGRKTAVVLGPAAPGIAPESRPPLGRSVAASIFRYR